jgi:hypothetical protein
VAQLVEAVSIPDCVFLVFHLYNPAYLTGFRAELVCNRSEYQNIS